MKPASRRRVTRILLGTMGLLAVTYALFRTWGEAQSRVLPDVETLAIAGFVVVVSLIGGGMSWYALFGDSAQDRKLISDFYLAQLAKYLPGGGIWQMAGQVGLSANQQLPAVRLSINVAVHAVIQLSAALTLGSVLILATDLPSWLRVLCGFGLLAPLILHRSWMASVLSRVGKRFRLDVDQTVPPSQKSITRSWFWSLMPITGFSFAYGVMVNSLQPVVSVWQTAVAFAMAWAIGFVLIPFPAGLGVREAALVALVGGSTAVIVAASLALRLIAIGGDLLLASVTRRLRT